MRKHVNGDKKGSHYAFQSSNGQIVDNSRSVLGSARRPTIVNNLAVTALKRIMNPLFVTIDVFLMLLHTFLLFYL